MNHKRGIYSRKYQNMLKKKKELKQYTSEDKQTNEQRRET